MAESERNILYLRGREPEEVELNDSGEESEGVEISGPNRDQPRRAISYIALDRIRLSALQTRQRFDESEIEGLARSIKTKGVLQPIIVRPLNSAVGELYSYELVAGERRFRAAKAARLRTIPSIIQDLSDRESLEVAIIENAQRTDLNPIDEALAFKRMADEFGASQTEIARAIGKNRVTVSNAMRLLQLEPEVIEFVRSRELSAGHARALVPIEDPKQQLALARKIIEHGLSVRTVEELVQAQSEKHSTRRKPTPSAEDPGLERWQKKIGETLGTERVRLRMDAEGQRTLQIVFPTEAAWRRFTARLRD